jgi:hypothetical protein
VRFTALAFNRLAYREVDVDSRVGTALFAPANRASGSSLVHRIGVPWLACAACRVVGDGRQHAARVLGARPQRIFRWPSVNRRGSKAGNVGAADRCGIVWLPVNRVALPLALRFCGESTLDSRA